MSRSRVVLAMHGWLVASDTAADAWVPFYLQPSLGGHNTLRGYSDYRFHDRNLLVVNRRDAHRALHPLDAAVFADAGNVAARVADLNLDKRSYGVGCDCTRANPRSHASISRTARRDGRSCSV